MTAWQLTPLAGAGREVVHRIAGPFLGLLVHGPRIEGADWLVDLPRPLLICPNHESHLDVPVLRRSLGRHGRRRLAIAAADDYWFHRRAHRFIVSWFAAVPFRRIGRGAESIHAVEELLADGWRVVIFPEGTRSRTSEMAPFKAGVGLVAVHARVPVLPVRIDGLWEVLPPGARRPHRRAASVRFGRPLIAEDGESARDFTERLEAAVRAL